MPQPALVRELPGKVLPAVIGHREHFLSAQLHSCYLLVFAECITIENGEDARAVTWMDRKDDDVGKGQGHLFVSVAKRHTHPSPHRLPAIAWRHLDPEALVHGRLQEIAELDFSNLDEAAVWAGNANATQKGSERKDATCLEPSLSVPKAEATQQGSREGDSQADHREVDGTSGIPKGSAAIFPTALRVGLLRFRVLCLRLLRFHVVVLRLVMPLRCFVMASVKAAALCIRMLLFWAIFLDLFGMARSGANLSMVTVSAQSEQLPLVLRRGCCDWRRSKHLVFLQQLRHARLSCDNLLARTMPIPQLMTELRVLDAQPGREGLGCLQPAQR
mmetsp:Transcript_19788/g.55387  ORF Transcript_19788/g.55387 Transcript_19788/m.55387 type:complete len:331 (-) Transcript_19788:889-1881(-)